MRVTRCRCSDFLDTVENELIFCKDKNSESDLEKIREYLKDTDLWHKKTNHPQKLSGGQKQRLAIITSFLSGRKTDNFWMNQHQVLIIKV